MPFHFFNNLKGVLEGVDYNDFVTRYRAESLSESARRIAHSEIDKSFLIDIFYIHYLPIPFLKNENEIPKSKRLIYKFIREAMESQEVQENRRYTITNSSYSMLYTISYVKYLVDELKKREKNAEDEQEKKMITKILNQIEENPWKSLMNNFRFDFNQQDGEQQRCEIGGQQNNNVDQQNSTSSSQEETKQEDNLLSSIYQGVTEQLKEQLLEEQEENINDEEQEQLENIIKEANEEAIKKASEDVQEIRRLTRVLGGRGAGNTTNDLILAGNMLEMLKISRNTEINKILEYLNGLSQLSSISKKKSTRFSRGELYGYELGSDLERIVHSELALPDEVFYAKFVQSELLLYEKRVNESKGAIFVLLDKSGSMDDYGKIVWAKAVALALYNRARREKREFYVRFFDANPHPLYKVPKNAKSKNVVKMLEYLATVNADGGTDINRAIITACQDIQEGEAKGISEIILITDGIDEIAGTRIREALEEANAKVITVMIMDDNKDLKKISEKYMKVEKLNAEEMLKVVEY